jgi:starch-binding outer membrane protein, SusD/RagB family
MKNIFKKLSPLALAFIMLTGCEKEYLDTKPTNQVPFESVFTNTDAAYVALNGTYRSLWTSLGTGHDAYGQKAVDLTMDLMGNDMMHHTQGYTWFIGDYRIISGASAAAGSRSEIEWQFYYRTITNVNNILANLEAATGSDVDKENIKGQALALRAYCYFYLTNLWQHTYKGHENALAVPLYTEPTIVGKPRATVQEVYNQIVADLTQAETLLTGKTRKHISHINAATAKGIRARVALQMEDWQVAATKAAEARQGATLMTAAAYPSGFAKSNSEWIWGLEVPNDQATIYASFFSHMDPSAGGYATLGNQKKITKELYDKIPAGDVRKTVFRTPGTGTSTIPDYTGTKFKLPTAGSWAGDYVLMRASELYLIEAEANARLGQDAAAKTALETLVKTRFPAYVAPATNAALINEVLLQRRIELWGEGFSLLDLKRLKLPLNRPTGEGNHNATLAQTLTLPAEDPKWLFRIPQDEINQNESIEPADQNP